MSEVMEKSAVKISEVTGFLYEEASCLDEGRLQDWMELYSDEGVYWMPASLAQTCPLTEISILYEDKLLMDIRRRNFGHTLAPSMEYPVRGSRLIGNVRIVDEASDGTSLQVKSGFHAQLYYREELTMFAGSYTHTLVHEGGTLKIAQKRVDLINADGVQRNLLIYI